MLKIFLAHLASFAAGAAAGDAAARSKLNEPHSTASAAFLKPTLDQLLLTCQLLKGSGPKGVAPSRLSRARRGAALYALDLAAPAHRTALASRSVRSMMTKALGTASKDRDPGLARDASHALQRLREYAPDPEEERIGELRFRLDHLRWYVDVPASKRRVVLQELARAEMAELVSRDRAMDFLVLCKEDFGSRGRTNEEWLGFLQWFLVRDDVEKDNLVLLCTHVDSRGVASSLPGFSEYLEQLMTHEP